MEDYKIPVYLITGFLESGKTSFIQFTIQQDYFADGEKTLLIACEEGEEEYDLSMLANYNTVLEMIEEPEEFTPEVRSEERRVGKECSSWCGRETKKAHGV